MIYFFFSKTLQTIRFLPLQTHRMESFVAFSLTRYFTHPSFDTKHAKIIYIAHTWKSYVPLHPAGFFQRNIRCDDIRICVRPQNRLINARLRTTPRAGGFVGRVRGEACVMFLLPPRECTHAHTTTQRHTRTHAHYTTRTAKKRKTAHCGILFRENVGGGPVFPRF